MNARRFLFHVKGYTLLEMAVVIILFMILGSVGVNSINGVRDHLELRLEAQKFAGELHRARVASIACGTPIKVIATSNRREAVFSIRDTDAEFSRIILPGGITFKKVPSRPLVFHTTGTCSPAGTFMLGNDSVSARVVVSILGRVRWEIQ